MGGNYRSLDYLRKPMSRRIRPKGMRGLSIEARSGARAEAVSFGRLVSGPLKHISFGSIGNPWPRVGGL